MRSTATKMNLRLEITSATPLTLVVHFDRDQVDEFLRPISGGGGGQIFVRMCQELLQYQNRKKALRYDWTLTLHGGKVTDWFRLRDYPGGGGFESRLGRMPRGFKPAPTLNELLEAAGLPPLEDPAKPQGLF